MPPTFFFAQSAVKQAEQFEESNSAARTLNNISPTIPSSGLVLEAGQTQEDLVMANESDSFPLAVIISFYPPYLESYNTSDAPETFFACPPGESSTIRIKRSEAHPESGGPYSVVMSYKTGCGDVWVQDLTTYPT